MINSECPATGANCTTCHEVFSLFEQLHVPHNEQEVLWNMAHTNKECNQLMQLLEHLLHK